MKLPPISTIKGSTLSGSEGFTLIEIIIGLAVISIVSTLGLTSWQSFSHYQAEAEFNNLETSFRAERANSPESFNHAITVERIINNHRKIFYITEVGAILTHLPQHE